MREGKCFPAWDFEGAEPVPPANDTGFVQNKWPQKFHTCGRGSKRAEFGSKHFRKVVVPLAVMGLCFNHSVKNAVCKK